MIDYSKFVDENLRTALLKELVLAARNARAFLKSFIELRYALTGYHSLKPLTEALEKKEFTSLCILAKSLSESASIGLPAEVFSLWKQAVQIMDEMEEFSPTAVSLATGTLTPFEIEHAIFFADKWIPIGPSDVLASLQIKAEEMKRVANQKKVKAHKDEVEAALL